MIAGYIGGGMFTAGCITLILGSVYVVIKTIFDAYKSEPIIPETKEEWVPIRWNAPCRSKACISTTRKEHCGSPEA